MQKISRRNIFVVLLVALTWLSFVISGSHALLNDSASLTGNTLTVGSAGLLVSNSQNASSTIYEKTRDGFSFPINPGDSVDRYFLLKNTSSTGIALEIDVTATIATANSNIFPYLTLDFVPVDGQGVPLADSLEVGSSMNALKTGHITLPGVVAQGATQRYRLRTMLAKEMATPLDSIQYDLIFTGTQKVL